MIGSESNNVNMWAYEIQYTVKFSTVVWTIIIYLSGSRSKYFINTNLLKSLKVISVLLIVTSLLTGLSNDEKLY